MSHLFYNIKNGFKYIVISFFSIVFMSSTIMLNSISIDNEKYSRNDATGFKLREATQFFYFYKNLGLFPLAVEKKDIKKLNGGAGKARRFIKEHPEKLRMEIKHWYRFGESARIWALFPSYYTGEPINKLTLKPLNATVFSITGVLLLIACYKLGGIIVALAGVSLYVSSPFLLSESFLRDNIFAIQPMLHIFAISLFIILHGKQKWYLVAASVFVALISGLFSEIRGENITVLLVPILYWLVVSSLSLKGKILVTLAVVSSFILVKSSIREHFEDAYERTYKTVESVGGVTFDGSTTGQHPVWHPFLAGLGDYGQDKGFLWSDIDIFYRVLGKSGFTEEEIRNVVSTYYDPETQYYYKRPETVDNYSSLAWNEFLGTIMDDPFWYASILIKRAVRIVTDVPPITFYVLDKRVEVGFYSLVAVLVIVGLLVSRQSYINSFSRLDVFVVLGALSMSGIAFLIHTGKGATYGTVLPLMISVILISKCIPIVNGSKEECN
ncbi:hypothetical protein [Enterovibrio norvegicus]|uniref:Glycosyltransferase RgtA/B/C/D-like domain-containing protein n=1 Tax=Enterovibrio norvegicus TaxID=188144 RepID=A0A2N7L5N3_9GAMM|nr:hypothetical protein [Enterovibrio norvegicus]PMN88924.1 hypothetical protein BCT23_05325 [Enterovibrio norvegicus]